MNLQNNNVDLSIILDFIKERNDKTFVDIKKIPLEACSPWFYDDSAGSIHNGAHSFFEILGAKYTSSEISIEQPIILQEEIGYLGMLCAKTEKGLEFLMQAKIEPGNINCIQISPTIQATKSNFTQKHGGRQPAYLEYFLNAKTSEIIVDQIQSEQSSRFYKKRNRNIIVFVEDKKSIPVLKTHMWMTLAEVKTLMSYDNLVNMDTRTVMSCLPSSLIDGLATSSCESLVSSINKKCDMKQVVEIYRRINNIKMFNDGKLELVDIMSLNQWSMNNNEFVHNEGYPFKVVFCDITIDGREVKNWKQPLFEATDKAIFGLICQQQNGIMKFLVKVHEEIGCFDSAEVGPTIQMDSMHSENMNCVEELFFAKLKKCQGVIFDTILSEEGGRFYHEENRNIIIELGEDEVIEDNNYIWCDYATLNTLTQVNNCINIQLRNLLSVLPIY